MEASSTVVIKVKYGDMLRRFNAQIVGEQLSFRMDGLREKILNLFSFNPDTELVLTYIDEDDDVVTLVDDDDLSDVVKQGLDPLRVTVKVKGANTGKHDTRSSASASSTPLRSPRVQQPLENLNTGVAEILKSVPEPLRDTLMKLSADLASKASSSAPSITELVDQFSKVGLSFLGQLTESSQPGVKTAATETNGSEVLKVDSDGAVKDATNEATQKNNEVKIQNVPGESMEGSSSGFIKVVQPGNDSLPNFAPVSTQNVKCVGKKENFKKVISMRKSHLTSQLPPPSANNAGKEMSNPSEPKIGPKPATVGASPWTPFPGLNTTDPFFGGMPPVYDCPFSGAPFGNMPPPPAHSSSTVRSSSQNDGIGNVFHRGVRCDGCGVHPITGPRFKSRVKVNYDLCCICFEEMGNHSDYIRMDRPAVYRHHMPFKGLHDSRTNDWNPTSPQVYKGFKVKPTAVKLDSRFILDVNIFDGTVMAPLSPFTKIWRMRNNGTTVWPQKTQLVWIGGDKLSNEISVEVQIPEAGLMMDQELDVAVDFIAPELPGRYVSYWRMSSPSGQKFGQRVWVLIQVDTSLAETPRGSVRNLNLNLPPTGPEMINVNPEPTIEDNNPENENSKKIVELVQPNTEQDLKFPINDSLFVGNGASTSSTPSSSSSPPPPTVSYPIIDLSDVAPRLPSVPSPMLYPPPPAPPAGAQQAEENEVEQKLLRELEEMGFKEVDLNIEVLRMHEYDLEQAVDDLCGVAEWDPILEELQEMGFGDTVMNKMLLKKNNGSIKRVVMDLIAGENN
ncbi:hypothetical protein ABFX02_04G172600 [Erythranthe guttata]